MPHRPNKKLQPHEARNAVVEIARYRPEQALRLAEDIADPWFRAQSLGWVSRYATSPETAERAFMLAREAAGQGKDAFRKSTMLVWPIRAAIETRRLGLAGGMFAEALAMLPAIPLYCSRAYAIELLFPAAFPGGPRFRRPLISRLPELCPIDSHWRALRLHVQVAACLAWEDAATAAAFVQTLPAGKPKDRVDRYLARGMKYPPRDFFW